MLHESVNEDRGILPVAPACASMGVSRSWYAQRVNRPVEPPPDSLLDRIMEIGTEFPRYGYRRITKQLHRNGVNANHKKVLKTMKEHGLTRKQRKRFIRTTDSDHGFTVYPNLIQDMEVTRLNQVWVSDITYVHLDRGFAYLAVVIDRYSRKVIGWQLSREIDAQLSLDALDRAFEERKEMDLTGLIHHSDQGVQYACHAYTNRLTEHGIKISMSRRGNPYDNAYAESFMKTFKYEEVYLTEYTSFQDAYSNIKQFIEKVYNQKRLHSSIGYQPPAELEAKILNKIVA